MLFNRVFQHLLPHSPLWRLREIGDEWTIGEEHTIGEPGLVIGGVQSGGYNLWRLFRGLSSWPERFVAYVDAIYLDQFPETTRELAAWEKQFGLEASGNDATRRLNLAAEWAATGGQSPAYFESILQTAGFPVYVHDWWDPVTDVTRDPHDYTDNPLIGTNRCTAVPGNGPTCSAFPSQPRCNAFLNNDVHYLINKDRSLRAPHLLPTDPNAWPFFFYVGGATFPDEADIPAARRDEFERLLLKLRPLHLWIVTLINYT